MTWGPQFNPRQFVRWARPIYILAIFSATALFFAADWRTGLGFVLGGWGYNLAILVKRIERGLGPTK